MIETDWGKMKEEGEKEHRDFVQTMRDKQADDRMRGKAHRFKIEERIQYDIYVQRAIQRGRSMKQAKEEAWDFILEDRIKYAWAEYILGNRRGHAEVRD
jgi:hypothetical protein